MASELKVGDRIHCKNWKDLEGTALHLSAEGYGVAVIGFTDMSDNVITITDMPLTLANIDDPPHVPEEDNE